MFTNYNNSPVTREAIASIDAAAARDRVRVVIVDNGSDPGDVRALKSIAQEFPNTHLILNDENVGYFRGLNIGMGVLRQRWPQVEYVVVGNNDLVFPANFVDKLQEHAEVFDLHAVVAPDLITPDGVHQNPHVLFPIGRMRKVVWDIYFFGYWAALAIRHLARLTRNLSVRRENAIGSDLFQSAGPIEQGYGACYILGPVFFRHFTRLCAPTFIMQEEFFIGEQLNTIGQMVYYDPRFVVLHHDHATVDMLPGRRHWELSKDAHRVYKRYLRLPHAQRVNFINAESR